MRKIALCLLAILFCTPAFAHSFQSGPLKIGHPWALPTAPGATDGAVYLAFFNTGTTADQLQGATTSIAQKVTLQQADAAGAVTAVNGIDLPAGRGVAFRPNGSYLKLQGLKGGLAAGDKFTLKLKFASAPPVDVTVFVEDKPAD